MSFSILLSLTAQLMPVYQQNVPQHYYLLDTLVNRCRERQTDYTNGLEHA